LDRVGRVVSCEHGRRRVSRIEHDGSITDLASSYSGKRLNSPNDVVVKSDGSIWFTDPTYGIDSDYEGHQAISEIGASYVYRIDPETGEITAMSTDFSQGKIKLPEAAANVEFGGPKRNRLYICATQSLYSVYLRTNGADPTMSSSQT
jgi:sugar lactone lactonase YvrE